MGGGASVGEAGGLREKYEALAMENRALKEATNHHRQREAALAAQASRLEKKLAQSARQVATLLEGKGDSSRAAVAEIRRENEKALVVSRLREQVGGHRSVAVPAGPLRDCAAPPPSVSGTAAAACRPKPIGVSDGNLLHRSRVLKRRCSAKTLP